MSTRFMGAVGVSLALLASSAFAQDAPGKVEPTPDVSPDRSASLPDLSGWTLNLGFGFGGASAGALDSGLFTFNFGFTILSGVRWTSEDFGTYTRGTIESHDAVPIYGIGFDVEFGFLDEGDLFSLAIPFDYVVTIDAEGDSAWPALTLGGRFGYSAATFDVLRRDSTNSFDELEEATMDVLFLEPVAAVRLFTAFGMFSLEAYLRIGFVVSSEFPARTLGEIDPSIATTYGIRLSVGFGF